MPAIGAALVAGLLLAAAGSASSGQLDTSFGTGGKVVTRFDPIYDEPLSIALQPDGRIVGGGYDEPQGNESDFALARYLPNGSLDTSFGTGGKVLTPFGADYNWINKVLVQPADEKIIGVGFATVGSTGEFGLARYNPNGSLDTSFGKSGLVTTPIGSQADAQGAVLQSEGKIVAGGYARMTDFRFVLARYQPNGALDTTFGTKGVVTTSFGPKSSNIADLALQPDGKIVAAGTHYDGSNYSIALARYNPNGALDTSFGTGGKKQIQAGTNYSVAHAVTLQPNGKILVAGYSGHFGASTAYTMTIVRLNPNGSLDTSFGTGGKATVSFGTATVSAPNAVLVQANGKIVAAGYTRPSASGVPDVFALARFSPNGSLDPSFGSGGKVTSTIGQYDDYVDDALLQPDGKIVAAGATAKESTYTDYDWALVRYQGDSFTLHVKFTGNGEGGIGFKTIPLECTSSCSAQIAAGSQAVFAAGPKHGSALFFGGACHGSPIGNANCVITMDSDKTAIVKFERCVVPKLKGRKLRGAKRALRKNGCALGKIKKKHSSMVKKGRVLSQKPKPGTKRRFGYRVRVTLGKGP